MIVVRVTRYDKWSADYIVPTTDIDIAKEVAFQNATRTFSCVMPATKEMMESDIEIISADADFVLFPVSETSNRKAKCYCASCRTEDEVKKDNAHFIDSCSAKGSMSNLVSNY